MGSTMAFVAASVVLVVAGLIFPARVFSILNTQRAISTDGTEAGFRAPRPPSPPRAATAEIL